MDWGDTILVIIPLLILVWSIYKYIKLLDYTCNIFNNRNEQNTEQQQEIVPEDINLNRRSQVEVIRIIIVENPNKYFKNDSTETCPICLDTMEIGEGNLASMSCQHTFHKHCIIEWLKVSNMCPICRT